MEQNTNIDEQNDLVAVDGAKHRKPPPQCFKLNLDSWKEVFKWFSIHNVHSVSQMCTRLKPVAGLYFHQKYKSAICGGKDGIYFNGEQINGFSQFTEHTYIEDFRTEQCEYMESTCNKALSRIFLDCVLLDTTKLKCIKGSLNKIETVELSGMKMDINVSLCNDFLKFFPNLKHLKVEPYEMWNDWLL